MINSSNTSLVILIIFGAVLFLTMNLFAGKDRKLPPISTPEGKKGRAIIALVLAAFIGANIIYIQNSGRLDDGKSIRRMILSMVAGAGVGLFLLVKDWKKSKNDK